MPSFKVINSDCCPGHQNNFLNSVLENKWDKTDPMLRLKEVKHAYHKIIFVYF